MTYLRFEVPGVPVAQGSKRHVGNGRMIESSIALKPWRAEVMAAAIAAADASPDWYSTDTARPTYGVGIRFSLRRPKSHLRVTGAPMPSAPEFPGVKPDLDKLVRAVFDALTQSGVIGDDAQIVRMIASKFYVVRTPGVAVQLERLT